MTGRPLVRQRRDRAAQRQSGIGLIELMIALLIGLFVVLGLTLILINMKNASTSQNGLGNLQDRERLALSVLTTTIQSARYFPDPMTQTAESALVAQPASAMVAAMEAGQGITGTDAAAPLSESITARFVTAPGEGVMDCLGDINSGAGSKIILNTFWVDTKNKELRCSVDGGLSSTVLVHGVESMAILYGTDTTGPTGSGNTDRYLDRSEVEGGRYWSVVRTVRITVRFSDPYQHTSPGTPATIEWTQAINLMNQA